MTRPSKAEHVVVLRKTKLGESDLILTMLASDGSLLKAVAKGARKPTSPFSSRLELYTSSDILVAEGRSLGIVQEARLIAARPNLHSSLERAACAAPVAELLWRIAQEGLPAPRLFDFAYAAFDALDAFTVQALPRVCAASLIKTLAFCGLRPSLDRCVSCGGPVNLEQPDSQDVCFSFAEGGAVCPRCREKVETVRVSAATLTYANALLMSTFSQISQMPLDQSRAFAVLQLEHQLVREHVGSSLRSLGFLLTSGLY